MSFFKIFLLFFFLQVAAYAQFPNGYKSLKLQTHPSSGSILYNCDSVIFYFDRKTVINFLNRELKKDKDKSFQTLLDTLKKTKTDIAIKVNDMVVDPRTGNLHESDYEFAIERIEFYLLIKGKVAVFDKTNKIFSRQLFMNFRDSDLDIKGSYIVVDLLYPNGKVFYSKRAYNEEFDLLIDEKLL